MDRVNLTGVDLQRAIAERKGWKNLRTEGEVWGLLHGDDPQIPGRRTPPYFPEDDNLHQFHALLGELVEEGWRWDSTHNGRCMYAYLGPGSDCREEIVEDAPDFCTAVGNLWLRCRG